MTYVKFILLGNYVLESMEDVKKNVDCLFSKADQLDPKDLEQNFNTIMENGEKAVEQSGKHLFMNISNNCVLKKCILENKIQMASSMQALLEKYIKRLNIDILNFQVDLKEQYGDVTRDIDKSKNTMITYIAFYFFIWLL